MQADIFRRSLFAVAVGAVLFSAPLFAGAASFNTSPSNLQARALGNSCIAEVTWDWVIDSSRDSLGPNNNINFFLQRKSTGGGVADLNDIDAPSNGYITDPPPLVQGTKTTYSYRYEERGDGAGLDPSRGYAYRVEVKRTGGPSFFFPLADVEFVGPGGEVGSFVRLLSGMQPPLAPTHFEADWVGSPENPLDPVARAANRAIQLTWKGDVLLDIGGFDIFRAAGDSAFPTTPTKTLIFKTSGDDSIQPEGGVWTYLDPDLDTNESYRYKIRAFNEGTSCPGGSGKKVSLEETLLPEPVAPVPVPPPAPEFEYSSTQDDFRISWNYTFPQAHHFIMYVTHIFTGSSPEYPVASLNIPGVPGGSHDYSRLFPSDETRGYFPLVQPSTRYAVKICAYRDDVDGQSNLYDCYEEKNIETGIARPVNLEARISNVTPNGANVSASIDLIWRDQSRQETGFIVEYMADGIDATWHTRLDAACSKGQDVADCTHSYSGPPATLRYRVRAVKGGEWSDPSVETSVDLRAELDKIRLKGWAWANAGGSAGNELGIGWISLSSQNVNAGTGASYNVFLSGTEDANHWRELSGYAWSGIRCTEDRGAGVPCGYGWLSFEGSDLLGKCPAGTGCAAQVNSSTGEVRGWAKFLAATPTNGAWTGWVSLRERGRYGVCLGDMGERDDTGASCKGFKKSVGGALGFFGITEWDEEAFEATLNGDNVFSGWAWGDAVGGWIQFTGGATPPVPPVGGACSVTGVRFTEEGRPTGEIGLGRTFPFDAEVVHEGDCSGVSNINELEWSIVPLPGSMVPLSELGTIDARTGFYAAPDRFDGTRPFSVTIKPQSVVNPAKSTSGTFTIWGDASGCSVNLSMDPNRVPSVPIPLGGTFPFGVNITRTPSCPSLADQVDWTIRPEGDEFGTTTADGIYTAPLVNPGLNPTIYAISKYNSPAYRAFHTFAIAEAGGGGTGPDVGVGLSPCQVLGVSIQGLSRNINLGGSADFTASVSDNERCGPHTLDWSIVENVADSSYGSVVSPAPGGGPNSARYRPNTPPLGKTPPFDATVKVCVDGSTTLCDIKTVEVRDLEPYVSASCADPGEPRISVGWGGMPVGAGIQIQKRQDGSSDFSTIHTDNNQSGAYSDRAVELNTTYYYKAIVTYDGFTRAIDEDPAECRPAVVFPTNVQVFTQSADTLWVNWKDNDTRPNRKFFVERVRLTPALLTYPDNPAVVLGDSEIRLQWDNTTNWTPYNHVIARLINPIGAGAALVRFSAPRAPLEVLKTISGVEIIGEGENLLSFVPDSPNVTPAVNKKRFSRIDGELEEGTTYYYRVASCSQIPLQVRDGVTDRSKYLTRTIAGAVGKPEVACGLFSEAIATTTELKAPTGLTAQALSRSQIQVRWTDNSLKEGGYEIYRGGVRVATTTLADWTDSGLSPDTEYSYRVRAVKDFGGSVGRIYSKFSESRSATTHFTVSVSVSGSGTGTVLPCSSGTCEYPKGSPVTLTATPSDGSIFEEWSGGGCSGTGTCTATGNKSVTATFNRTSFFVTLRVAGTGGGTLSGGEQSCSKTAIQPDKECGPYEFTGGQVLFTAIAFDGSTFTFVAPTNPSGCNGWDNINETCIVNNTATITATFNAGGAGFSSFQDKLTASILDVSGFVRKVASPLFAKDATRNVGRSDILPAKGGVLRSRNIGDVRPRDQIGQIRQIGQTLISRGRKLFSRFLSPLISGAATAPDYEAFFVKNSAALSNLNEAAVKDAGLEPDTVYIYRVRSCVGTDATDCTAWSDESAGKTLRGDITKVEPECSASASLNCRPICTRNSFCSYGAEFTKNISPIVSGALVETEESQQQCRVNADCADVGRFEQSFKER